MSRTYKDSNNKRNSRERHISIRAVRRDPPDLRKLSRAIIALAMSQAAAEADSESKAADQALPTPASDEEGSDD
jgi:hypothetical protein